MSYFTGAKAFWSILLPVALASQVANECSLAGCRHVGSALVQSKSRSQAQQSQDLREDSRGEAKDFDVDLVYTWAGNPSPGDEYYEEIDATCGLNVSADAGPHKDGFNRFRDTGTLKFSFISVGQHLPWVRRIFLVTSDGALPSWLGELEPNLTSKVFGVSHQALWPVALQHSELPTHNSNAIEANLYRIPGLAEHFIYLNDDMFIGRELPRSEFFSDQGRAIWWTIGGPDKVNYLDGAQNHYLQTLMEQSQLNTVRDCMQLEPLALLHQAKPYTKSAAQAMHVAYADQLAMVGSQRCRPTNGSSFVPIYFLDFYQVHLGLAEVVPVKGQPEYSTMYLDWSILEKGEAAWYDMVRELRPKRFCINDDFSDDEITYAEQISRLHYFFGQYFGPPLNPKEKLQDATPKEKLEKLFMSEDFYESVTSAEFHKSVALLPKSSAKEPASRVALTQRSTEEQEPSYLPLSMLSMLMVVAVSPILFRDGAIPFFAVLSYIVALTLVRLLVKQTMNEGYDSSSCITVMHMLATSTVASIIDPPLMKEAIPSIPIALVIGLGISFGNAALVYSSLAFAAMLGTCSPAVTLFVEICTGRRKTVTCQIAVSMTMVIVGGLFCVQGETSCQLSGVLLILGALVCRSMKVIWQQDLLQIEMPPLHLVAWSSIWTAVYMLPVALRFEGLSAIKSIPSLPWQTLVPLAGSAVCAAVLNICQVYVVKYLGSLLQSITGNLSIIMVIASASTVMGENITVQQYQGIVLMTGGVLMFKARLDMFWCKEDNMPSGEKSPRPSS